MYIERNAQNQIVGVFAEKQYEGQEFLEGAELYAQPPSPLARIRALEAYHADDQAKLTRQSLLPLALDKACADPLAAGMSREQVHAALMAANGGYAKWYNLEQTIAELRTQL